MMRFRKALISTLVLIGMSLTLSCSKNRAKETQGEQATASHTPSLTQEQNLEADWEQAFRFVRDAIRTEPSHFPLKTPEGVRWSQSGNSLEKALLLAQLLQDAGYSVEIVEGELDERTAGDLLRKIFPAAGDSSYQRRVRVSAPAEDARLRSAVKRHYWVRMEEQEGWIDLDPSFPGAEPGLAYALPDNTYDPYDEGLKTQVFLSLEVRDESSPEQKTVLSWEGMLEDMALRPVSLSIVAEFERAEGERGNEEEEEEGIAGLFGAMSGESSSKGKSRPETAVAYNAVLQAEDEVVASEKFSPEEGAITRMALKMRFESMGETVSSLERILFERRGRKNEPPLFQRHAILISGGWIPEEVWQNQLEAISDKAFLSEIKSQVEDLKKTLKEEKLSRETLKKSLELEERLGPGLGHLVNMIFASASDELTLKEGEALSVFSYFPVPRVIITSFTGERERAEVSLDLRQDRVEAIPLPGQAAGMKKGFLYGRGVMGSILEGKLLELLTGKPSLTTAVLMQEAERQEIPLRAYSRIERESLQRIGLPEDVAEKVYSTLDSGRIVIIPDGPIEWEGEQRWGWWDVDPQTMETTGVLDTGLHQGVVEKTILETHGPLESEMGYVIGAMVGAVDTYWVLSAMILEYGELNEAALAEAKTYLENIKAIMCPGFEKKVTIASSPEPEDCFDILGETLDVDTSIEGGIEITQGWCENFATGFGCASSLILNYYSGQ